MKSHTAYRYRRWIGAAMLVLALTCGPRTLLVTSLSAQTAPAGKAATEIDQETKKPIVTTDDGLKYVDLVVGTGPLVHKGQKVSVSYVGKLIDGTKFDASADHGGSFDYVQGVTSLIRGWTEGTSTMHVGGERKLIIPPQLGYGMQGAGDAVPPNATLIFDIKLLSINP